MARTSAHRDERDQPWQSYATPSLESGGEGRTLSRPGDNSLPVKSAHPPKRYSQRTTHQDDSDPDRPSSGHEQQTRPRHRPLDHPHMENRQEREPAGGITSSRAQQQRRTKPQLLDHARVAAHDGGRASLSEAGDSKQAPIPGNRKDSSSSLSAAAAFQTSSRSQEPSVGSSPDRPHATSPDLTTSPSKSTTTSSEPASPSSSNSPSTSTALSASTDQTASTSPPTSTPPSASTSPPTSTPPSASTSSPEHSPAQRTNFTNLTANTALTDRAAAAAPEASKDADPAAKRPANRLPPNHIVSVLHSQFSSTTPSATSRKRKFYDDPLDAVKSDQERKKAARFDFDDEPRTSRRSRLQPKPLNGIESKSLLDLDRAMNDKLDLATILSLPLDVRQVLIQEKKEALARLEASVAYDELEAHEKNEFICGRDAKPGDVVYLKVVERLMDESIPDSDPRRFSDKDGDWIRKRRPCVVFLRETGSVWVWKGHSYGNSRKPPAILREKTCQLLCRGGPQPEAHKNVVQYSPGFGGSGLDRITFLEFEEFEKIPLSDGKPLFEFAGRLEPRGYEVLGTLAGLAEDGAFREYGRRVQEGTR